ncbi:MAG TPA: peptidylprolyl isomerase [Phycisphaerales bacterium]|nr:peptidylprolyl isomerase [Phycisphaerales bacterium]HMP36807.1 peptidylprolyl isomerase [Phycisphaerales bacterium]
MNPRPLASSSSDSLLPAFLLSASAVWAGAGLLSGLVVHGGSAPRAAAASQALQPTDTAEIDLLRRQYGDLSRWVSTRGVGPDERRELDAFRRRLTAFLAAAPEDAVAQAMLVQTSIWLGDGDAVEREFSRLVTLRPGDDAVLATWARYWMGQNRFDRVVAVVEANRGESPAPRAVAQQAEAMIALHRFADAIAALDGIDPGATAPDVAAEVARLRAAAEASAAAWVIEQELRSAEAQRDDLPRVEFVVARGDADRGRIVVELFEDSAPNAVANFVDLVSKGFYDGTAFHRVIPAFMAQGGDPNSRPGASGVAGQGGPGHRIAGEATLEGARKHFAGSLGMAHDGNPDNAGSQFYLCFVPSPHLDGIHTVFGRVIDGEDVLFETRQNDTIAAATVLRKRDREYVPQTLPPIAPPPPSPSLPPGLTTQFGR